MILWANLVRPGPARRDDAPPPLVEGARARVRMRHRVRAMPPAAVPVWVLLLALLVPVTVVAAEPTPAAPPRTAAVEFRWTMRMLEVPGVLARHAGGYRLEATYPEGPASMGAGDFIAVRVDERVLSGSVAPRPEGNDPARFAVILPADPALRPGQVALVLFTLTDRRGLGVPAEAVERNRSGETVRLVNPAGGVESRAVRTGEPMAGGYVEIVSGLDAGDLVLLPASTPGTAR